MKPKKIGRPPKPPQDRRTNSLRVPLTDSERELIDGAAENQGQRPVTWAREKLLTAAKRTKH